MSNTGPSVSDVSLGYPYSPPIPSGAGRFLDWYYPDYASLLSGASMAWKNRNGAAVTPTSSLGGTAAFNLATINGVGCQLYRTFAAADKAIQQPSQVLMFNPRTLASPIPPSGDDMGCIRFMMNICAAGGLYPADNVHDYGFGWVRSNALSGLFWADAADGMAVRILDAAHIQLGIRGPNGLILASFAYDTTQFHTCEMVYMPPTRSAGAQFAFLIDGQRQPLPAKSTSWAAGTNLPTDQFVGSRLGFIPYIANFLGQIGDNSLCIQQGRLIAAPSYAAAL
jgi:hypothetical protein